MTTTTTTTWSLTSFMSATSDKLQAATVGEISRWQRQPCWIYIFGRISVINEDTCVKIGRLMMSAIRG